MVRLELLHSARDGAEFDAIVTELAALPDCPIGELDWQRALHVYRELARRAPPQQRSVKHADLLIAAAAERAKVPLVHYDRDYETIASVTGQSMRWLAEPGTLR